MGEAIHEALGRRCRPARPDLLRWEGAQRGARAPRKPHCVKSWGRRSSRKSSTSHAFRRLATTVR
eukprot:8409348-Alexandrium_andersonii.AAC.1